MEAARQVGNRRNTSRRATVARRWRNDFKNETPQGTFGCQRKKLAAASRKLSRRATVAWRKSNIFRKSMTQGNCGPWHELAADRNITSRAGATRRKGNFGKKYSIAVNAERCWKYPACSTGIKDRGLKQGLRVSKQVEDPTTNAIGGCRSGQLSRLGGRSTCKKAFYEIVVRKIAKQTAGSSVGL